MMGDQTFFSVYKEVLDICLVEGLSFTKEDVDEMPPFERTNYIQLIREHIEALEEEKEKAIRAHRHD